MSDRAQSTEREDAIEAEAQAAAALVRASRRVEVLLIEANVLPAAHVDVPTHMTRAEYARRSRVSEATVSRWKAEGMPVERVGTTYRVDRAKADAWRHARGDGPTTPTKRDARDELDVGELASRAGLRAISGGRGSR